jgi:hypothetical protein
MIVSLLLLPRCVFYTNEAFTFQGNKFFGSGDQLKGQFPFSFSSSFFIVVQNKAYEPSVFASILNV